MISRFMSIEQLFHQIIRWTTSLEGFLIDRLRGKPISGIGRITMYGGVNELQLPLLDPEEYALIRSSRTIMNEIFNKISMFF